MPHGACPRNAIVASPGVTRLSTEVARAFHERGALGSFDTTLAYRPDAWLDRALATGARRLLGQRVDRALRQRSLAVLSGARVRRRPRWELLRALAQRLGATVAADRLWERAMLDFDAHVAERLTPAHGLLYGFEHTCRDSLTRAAQLGVPGVLDMSAAHFAFSQRILAEQVAAFPETRTEHWNATQPLATERNARKQEEFERAALIVANSRFTASTLSGTGVAAGKVRVVPLGAPAVDPGWRTQSAERGLRVLFAGNVAVHKGAHLLIAAWRALGADAGAELWLAGSWQLPQSMRAGLPASVRVLGNLASAELSERYRTASVLVLPSLLDGFGMVVTEALAHGLPVITTSNTGAADLIEEGSNGWVVAAGDVHALAERLQHCLDHPADLREMREAAERSAARRPWSVYRSELIEVVAAFVPA